MYRIYYKCRNCAGKFSEDVSIEDLESVMRNHRMCKSTSQETEMLGMDICLIRAVLNTGNELHKCEVDVVAIGDTIAVQKLTNGG